MTNRNLTEIILVSDRSGSMQSCREEAEGGINRFIEEQKDASGEAKLTMVQFDDVYEVIHNGMPIKDVPKYELHPRGWTALLDAIGKAISTVGERLSKTKDEDRPGLVVCVISTDGNENKSMEYTRPQIKEMIEHHQKNYNWQFQFLGANIDAIMAGGQMGISPAMAVNLNVKNIGQAYGYSSDKVKQMRSMTARGAESEELTSANIWTDSERDALRRSTVSD